MRILFLVSNGAASARDRAFQLAGRGLAARGHEVNLATPESTLELRRLMKDVTACFVHTEDELVMAASAAKLVSGRCAVIRRVPPFAVASNGARARFVSRFSPTGLLFSTAADRDAAGESGARLAPLGVDPAEHDAMRAAARAALGLPQDARLIACVHDGVARHGVLALLRTIALLSPRHPELHVAVLGATNADSMRMHGAALGVNAMVSYLGARDDDLAVIRAADFGWIAAEADGAALAALDFMACRLPVLADRTPLTEHYVADGVTGVLLPPADATTTAASIAAFLARRDSHAAMGNAGRARLQREFSFESMIRGYEDAIAAPGGGASTRSVA